MTNKVLTKGIELSKHIKNLEMFIDNFNPIIHTTIGNTGGRILNTETPCPVASITVSIDKDVNYIQSSWGTSFSDNVFIDSTIEYTKELLEDLWSKLEPRFVARIDELKKEYEAL